MGKSWATSVVVFAVFRTASKKARLEIRRALTNLGKISKMPFYQLGKLRKMGDKQPRLVPVPADN